MKDYIEKRVISIANYITDSQIEARNLAGWIKIGSFTVYKKVVQYEAKGYVVSETIKSGNMPEKRCIQL